jgi:hypothetical protein
MKAAIGDRVHHRGGIYSLTHEGGGYYWGTVLEVVPQSDGTDELRVQRDEAPFWSNDPTWWASYAVDRVVTS